MNLPQTGLKRSSTIQAAGPSIGGAASHQLRGFEKPTWWHRGATVWFAQSILPEPVEAVGAKLGISHRVHDVAVAQKVLQRAGIDPSLANLNPQPMNLNLT
jgi:hypothetical protein